MSEYVVSDSANTDLPETPHALSQSQMQYSRLMTRLAAIVFELEADGTILFINDAVTAVTGYQPSELIGQPYQDILFPGELGRQIDEIAARLQSGDVAGVELTALAKDGRRIILEFKSANQYDKDGRLEKI